jgi:hypothetical protein
MLGAVVSHAGAYAMTLDVEQAMPMVNLLQRMGKTWTLLQGLTLPIISYFDVRMQSRAQPLLSVWESFRVCVCFFCVQRTKGCASCVKHRLIVSACPSLLSQGALFNDIMKDAFGDTQIEDLWIRYFCISTNVSKARMQVHQSGPLWKYCRASMTVRDVHRTHRTQHTVRSSAQCTVQASLT